MTRMLNCRKRVNLRVPVTVFRRITAGITRAVMLSARDVVSTQRHASYRLRTHDLNVACWQHYYCLLFLSRTAVCAPRVT